MTYGWAILVVLVAIGALAYFGVLAPDKFLPSKCTLPAGIACIDHKASSTAGVTVVLRNGLGYDMSVVKVRINGCSTTADAAGATAITNGEKENYAYTVVACTGTTLTSGSKFNTDFTVTYTISDTGLEHISKGSITTRVE